MDSELNTTNENEIIETPDFKSTNDVPILKYTSTTQPPQETAVIIADKAKSDLSNAVITENSALSVETLPLEEKNAVLDLKSKIDVSDSGAVSSYGVDSQNKIAAFSDSVLKNIKTKDSGEASVLLTNLVVEIKGFNSNSEEKHGFLGIFGGVKKNIAKMQAGYDKVSTNLDTIISSLESHKRTLMKDSAMLDEMYANNYTYYKELTLYIIAGKEKLKDINTTIIPELRKKAQESNSELDTQKLNDMVNYENRFDKKINDLMLSRMISIQMAPQIRLIQNNNSTLIDKIQSSIVNSIPLWKNQIVIALGMENSKAALESQKQVTDMTNELLKKNSEMLKQGSLEIAAESEKSIISIETIRKTNEDLISTINGVIDIQQKGREARKSAESELMQLENSFKQALIDSSSKSISNQ